MITELCRQNAAILPFFCRFPLKIGKVPSDWWADDHLTNISAWRKERTGYPTQKPLALLERIIAATSNEGDVVLDPFCGCATTLIAAETLGRQWAGIDLSEKAVDLVKLRLSELPASLRAQQQDVGIGNGSHGHSAPNGRGRATASKSTSCSASKRDNAPAARRSFRSARLTWTMSCRNRAAGRTTQTTCNCYARIVTASRVTGGRNT